MGMIGLISGWALWCQIADQMYLMENWISFRVQSNDPIFKYWGKVILLSINIIMSLFFFPVFMLLLVQIKNLLINRTTY